MEKSMIDAASGGALGDMTPAEARNLIEKMASNSQQLSYPNFVREPLLDDMRPFFGPCEVLGTHH